MGSPVDKQEACQLLKWAIACTLEVYFRQKSVSTGGIFPPMAGLAVGAVGEFCLARHFLPSIELETGRH